jgi:hypothetical protein
MPWTALGYQLIGLKSYPDLVNEGVPARSCYNFHPQPRGYRSEEDA